jgi:hypothetical protein
MIKNRKLKRLCTNCKKEISTTSKESEVFCSKECVETYRSNNHVEINKKDFNINEEIKVEIDTLIKQQNNKCKICNVSFDKIKPIISHTHDNKIKGMICEKCDKGLKYFSNNIGFLKNAITFLEI